MKSEEVVPDDQIVISPTPPGTDTTTKLYYEVNVIQWGDSPVLDAAASTDIEIELGGAVNGWADLRYDISSTDVLRRFVRIMSPPLPAPAASTGGVDVCSC